MLLKFLRAFARRLLKLLVGGASATRSALVLTSISIIVLIYLLLTLLSFLKLSDVLRLDQLLELLDLLTVELNSHVVSSCNQVRCDLHLLHAKIVFIVIYILVLIIIVLVFTVAKSVILNLFAIAATFLSVELYVVFFIIASRIFLLVAILLVANHAF